VDGSSHLAIVTTLTNTGDETLEVLNDPETILSNLATDSFVIKNVDGISPEFVGYMVGFHVPGTTVF
jgi:peptidyl-Lys metalloendopeptidase